ncbi:MAG: CHASE2 domain-containing protein [Verrucomicrobia bacterium]|nr:CHASE2 domain-containing protein [Verrucomicrobiota bacterium]
MSRATVNRSRVFASLALTTLVALLGLLLLDPAWRPGASLLRNSYDSLHSLNGVELATTNNLPVVIVYLDLRSFLLEHQDPSHPWPRELHAKLLRRLTTAGARAVVFDIVFSDVGANAAADREFANALRDSGRVILAGESNDDSSHVTSQDQPWARLINVLPPAEQFASNAVAWGVASHIVDDDYVVRRFFAGFTSEVQPSLIWAAAAWLQLPATRVSDAVRAANEHWIRYYGPALAIPNVSYTQALDPAGVPENFFRDKIVFIGARPMAELFNERQDEFRNPFHSWKHKELFMPGVEVHATELLNLIRGDWLRRLSRAREMIILLAVALLFGGGLVWLRPIPATMAALAGAGVALGVSLAGFSRGVWFPWLIVSTAQIPVALGGSVLFYSVEWYRARKRFEASKKIADAKIREQAALIDKAHDAILVQDLNGRIAYSNPSAERLYGWKLGELQRADACDEMFSPDAETAGTARAAALKDGEWNGELRQQTRGGQVVTVASRWTLIRDEAGQPKALLIINSDVTEQKLLEAQFLRTQRMNTIGTLAGGMAHDLNNALAPILMGAQLLRRQAADEESRRLLAMIESSTHRGADMVRQVLLFARGRGGEFQRLELGALVKELEKMVRETFPKNITVETFLPRDLWPVRGNPTQLHQVLLNLCVNARDAMPAGGKLSFVADNVDLAEAEAAAIPDGQPGKFVSLLVSDTGTGIPPEVRAKMFEPFFTTKGEGRGTGIGLSTVMRIVKSHGGFLRVESEPGQGTSFEVLLPRAVETATTEIAAPTVGLARGQGELILVADDEQAICELLTAELTSCGYRVLAASNGEEAVRLFQKHASDVRLLITDCAMPVMDGLQTIRALREKWPDLPVILASGEDGADAEKIADVVLVNKPFALEEILSAVQNCLRGKR